MTTAAKKEKKIDTFFLQQQLCRVSGNKNVFFSFLLRIVISINQPLLSLFSPTSEKFTSEGFFPLLQKVERLHKLADLPTLDRVIEFSATTTTTMSYTDEALRQVVSLVATVTMKRGEAKQRT